MKIVSQKKGILIFYGFDLVLLLILVLALLPFSRKKNTPDKMTSALLNPDYVNEVSSIAITEYDEDGVKQGIKISKAGSFWTGSSSHSNYSFLWPCDAQTVNNLIAESCRVTDMFKVGDNLKAWKGFEVDEKSAVCVTFFDVSGGVLSSLYYGKEDPLTERIAFRTWSSDSVYETEDVIKSYLNTEESFWADPFIYPQCITGYSRSVSESLLRRGSIINLSPREGLDCDYRIKRDFENGAEAVFDVYKKDDEYIVIPYFKAGPAFSEEDRNAVESLSYRYTVSQWTLDRFEKEDR